MAYRKKGGSALMALAKAGGKRRRAAKKAAETKIGGKKYVTPVAKKKVAAKKAAPKKKVTPKKPEMKGPEIYRKKPTPKRKPHGRVIPKDVTPGRSTTTPNRKPQRTPAQRASARQKLLGEQKTLRKASEGMRYGSEYKGIPKRGKKEQEGMARSLELSSGGGLAKVAAAAGGAGALKLYQMYKAKKAADLAKTTAKAKRTAKAAEAKKLRDAELAASKKIEQGYARQRESARAASRRNARRR